MEGRNLELEIVIVNPDNVAPFNAIYKKKHILQLTWEYGNLRHVLLFMSKE